MGVSIIKFHCGKTHNNYNNHNNNYNIIISIIIIRLEILIANIVQGM